MKIRSGFVSNSSSSSFCILGVVTGEKVSDEVYQAIDDASWGSNKVETCVRCVRGIDSYYEQNLVGAEPDEMKDDETLAQFKARVVAELQKFGAPADLSVSDLDWHTDGGRDN